MLTNLLTFEIGDEASLIDFERAYRDVSNSLKKISKSSGIDQVESLYVASSVAIHMYAADFLLESTDAGVHVVWGTPGHRCGWLQLATMCFDYLTRSVFDLLDGASGILKSDINRRCLQIFNDPLIAAMVDAQASR